jgi:PII-like signaling protein
MSRDWHGHSAEGMFLRFVVHENRRCHGLAVHDWLLQQARRLGIPGGSAFRGIAGYGRHGVLTEEHFFELAADLPVEVRFVCSPEQADRLLNAVEEAELSLFYLISPTRYGVAGVPRADWSRVLPPMF